MNPRLLAPSMSLLAAFEASARHLSFTRAATELSLTQSAVSRQVQALERLLGVALFRRENRHIQLTDAGAMYLREIGGALQRIRNASLQALSYRAGGGSVHLAALPTFGAKWLMPRVSGFYARHPNTLVHLHSRIGQFDLSLAGIDAAIGVSDTPWPGLISHRLFDEHLMPVISPALKRERPINRAEDVAQHLLLQVTARSDVWHRWFRYKSLPAASMRLGPQFELTSHLIQAVAAGLGVGLVPSFLVEDELRSGQLVLALDESFASSFRYYLYIPIDRTELPAVRALTEWLLDTAAAGRAKG
ncbi:LysR substrate-binding domain-containing protein [Candidimonas nitroreducens]|uniref:LysR family transcriptional regulator n=1 Tax=Candidimonas nitroreducens TaxID=683354 RepID=A0A225MRT8_9BURK|nr:LysR substrate-binding domain-containing protein [Candidimonas nitroreducens]OWT63974.1 LysR family transcriptional regulator [Candidimonas nitroreducens]